MRAASLLIALLPWLVLVAAALVGLATDPDPRGFGTHEQFGFGPCGFREMLGGPCPTCGVTTSVSYLTHGSLLRAWATQPLGVLLVGTSLVAAPATLLAGWRGVDLAALAVRHGQRAWMVFALVVVACWLL